MKNILFNGLAAGLILIFFALLVVADRTTTLSSGMRKLVEVLLVFLLYGFLWLWVKNRDTEKVRSLPARFYHVQTWSSAEEIESYLARSSSTQPEYSQPDSLLEIELAKKR